MKKKIMKPSMQAMRMMAKAGGLKGYMNGGDVTDPLIKAQEGITVKPTADSTAYYKDEAKFQSNLGVLKSKYGLRKQAEEAMAKSREAYSNASRQKFKGKPGYDKNGFPIKR